jgi:hypothetical protein
VLVYNASDLIFLGGQPAAEMFVFFLFVSAAWLRAFGYSRGSACHACALRWLRSSASSLLRHMAVKHRGLPPQSLPPTVF